MFNKHKKKSNFFAKFIKKKIKRVFFLLLPWILLLFFCCSIIDFFFFTFPTEYSKDKNLKELRTYCKQTVEEYNKSNTLVDGKNVKKLSDSLKREEELKLKWSDVYSIGTFYNSITDKKIDKELLKTIAKELSPKFTYKTYDKTITVVKEVDQLDKYGNPTGKKIKKTSKKVEKEIFLTDADSPYGHYTYAYEKTKDTKVEDEEETTIEYYRNTSTELVGEQYERFDNYLIKLFKHKNLSKADMEIEREEIFMLGEGLLNEEENVDWLINNYNTLPFTFDSFSGAGIPPELMDALNKYCAEYKIPPWLICGFIYRESSFNPNCATVAYGASKWKNLTVADIQKDYSLNKLCAIGLMQTTNWDAKAKALGISNPKNAMSDINAQIRVGIEELYHKIKTYSHIDTKTTNIDWNGTGWEKAVWRGCQAYNGGVSKTYAYSKYLRRPDKTGVFDMADKYKMSMVPVTNGSGSELGNKVAKFAQQFIGRPYVWGATGPSSFDCSGLMVYCYKAFGISLPRTSQQQYKGGKAVNKNDLQPGDLLLFKGSNGTYSSPGHVGMYLGNGKYIHAPGRGKTVTIANLSTRRDFIGARRYVK